GGRHQVRPPRCLCASRSWSFHPPDSPLARFGAPSWPRISHRPADSRSSRSPRSPGRYARRARVGVKRSFLALPLATALGVGYIPFASGTFGSAVGLVLWWLMPGFPAAAGFLVGG